MAFAPVNAICAVATSGSPGSYSCAAIAFYSSRFSVHNESTTLTATVEVKIISSTDVIFERMVLEPKQSFKDNVPRAVQVMNGETVRVTTDNDVHVYLTGVEET